MSTKNFIPTIWSDLIFRDYDKTLVFASLVNREYEGAIRNFGDTVKINEIGAVTTNTYSGSVTYDDPEDASKLLIIDQKKYAAVQVDDIDEAQSKPRTLGEITRKMGVSMAETVDEFIASFADDAGLTTGLGTESVPISITSANVTTYMATIAQLMDENNNPQAGRVAVVPPWFIHKINQADITKNTDNSRTLESGYVGMYYGFDLYMSNSIEHNGATWYKPMFFLRNDTISFAQQILTTEAMRLEDSFKDGLRSLMVYGGKVTRPSSLATLICAAGAESA